LTLRVVWTQDARANLREIIRYIAQRSPAAARMLKDLVEAAPRTATLNPDIFRPGRVAGTREIVVHPNYIVVYRLTEHIEVLNVLHSRQSYPFE
jgi:toxin ParE1/3/4